MMINAAPSGKASHPDLVRCMVRSRFPRMSPTVMTSARGSGSAKNVTRSEPHSVGHTGRRHGVIGDCCDGGRAVARAMKMPAGVWREPSRAGRWHRDIGDRLLLRGVEVV